MTPADLIERLEHEQPSQELDDLIAVQVGRGDRLGAAPKFTSSIDAAVTLTPDGWSRDTNVVCKLTVHVWLIPTYKDDQFNRFFCGSHKSEAIANCIAAVKAHEALCALSQSLPKETG